MLKPAQIDKMSVADRLRAIEQLWEAVCRDAPDVASPQWHREVLADRQIGAKRGEAGFLTLAQLRARFRNQEQ